MDGWLKSVTHRKNILNGEYKAVGIGCFNMNGVYYWTQVFTDNINERLTQTGTFVSTDNVDVSSDYLGNIEIDGFDSEDINIDINENLTVGSINFVNREFEYGRISVSANELEWISSNENVFTVSDGIIDPVGIGSAILTVRYLDKEYNYNINITGEIVREINDIIVDDSDIIITKGDNYHVDALVAPANTNQDKTVYFEIEDVNIASVDNDGIVTGLNEGETNLILSTSNNITRTIKVIVNKVSITDIILEESNIEMNVNETREINVEVVPSEIEASGNVSYYSADENIVTVTEDGLITAINPGISFISICSKDNTNIGRLLQVKVIDSIVINNNEEEIKTGESISLDIRMLSGKDGVTFTYKSSNDSIASVDENGVVKGISTGRVKIKVTSSTGVVAYYPLLVMYYNPDLPTPPNPRPQPSDDYGAGRGGDVPVVPRTTPRVVSRVVTTDNTDVPVNNVVTNTNEVVNNNENTNTNEVVAEKKEETTTNKEEENKKEIIEKAREKEKKKVTLPGNKTMRLESLIGYGIIGVIVLIGIVIFMKIRRKF